MNWVGVWVPGKIDPTTFVFLESSANYVEQSAASEPGVRMAVQGQAGCVNEIWGKLEGWWYCICILRGVLAVSIDFSGHCYSFNGFQVVYNATWGYAI